MSLHQYKDLGRAIVKNGWGAQTDKSEYDYLKEMKTDKQVMCLLAALVESVESMKREIARLPEKLEKQRLAEAVKLATAERKAAEAREKAAHAELQAKLCEPPVMYSCDNDTLDMIPPHMIRRRF